MYVWLMFKPTREIKFKNLQTYQVTSTAAAKKYPAHRAREKMDLENLSSKKNQD
jgi:hypothetical protein